MTKFILAFVFCMCLFGISYGQSGKEGSRGPITGEGRENSKPENPKEGRGTPKADPRDTPKGGKPDTPKSDGPKIGIKPSDDGTGGSVEIRFPIDL